LAALAAKVKEIISRICCFRHFLLINLKCPARSSPFSEVFFAESLWAR
jgi:hypothetical protein